MVSSAKRYAVDTLDELAMVGLARFAAVSMLTLVREMDGLRMGPLVLVLVMVVPPGVETGVVVVPHPCRAVAPTG